MGAGTESALQEAADQHGVAVLETPRLPGAVRAGRGVCWRRPVGPLWHHLEKIRRQPDLAAAASLCGSAVGAGDLIGSTAKGFSGLLTTQCSSVSSPVASQVQR